MRRNQKYKQRRRHKIALAAECALATRKDWKDMVRAALNKVGRGSLYADSVRRLGNMNLSRVTGISVQVDHDHVEFILLTGFP